MSSDVAGTAHQVMMGVTIGGGGLSFLAMYSSEITVTAVVVSCVGSIFFGVLGKMNERKRNIINERNVAANEKRNEINERDMRLKIIKEMDEELQRSLKD